MAKGELIIIIYVTLFVISIFYNKLVAWMEREGVLNGYMALLVVGGVIYTLTGMAPIVGAETTMLIAGAFIASLAPMVVGDVGRYLKAKIDWRKFWGLFMSKEKDKGSED